MQTSEKGDKLVIKVEKKLQTSEIKTERKWKFKWQNVTN